MNSNNESEVINFFSRFLSSIFFVERIQSHKQKRFDKNNVRSWPKKKKKTTATFEVTASVFCYRQASVNWKAYRMCITLPSIALQRSGQLGSWKIIITKSRNTRIYVFIGCSKYHKYIK